MIRTQVVPIVWVVYSIACFYLVRPLRKFSYRALLTILPCMILILAGCHNLPYLHMKSVMIISFYWILTIRLIHLIVLSPEKSPSLRSFAWELLGSFIPIIKCESKHYVIFDLVSGSVKLLLNHWIYRWFLSCEPSDSYARMAMFYVWTCTGTYVIDAQIILVRLVTRDGYTLLPFSNYAFLSKSIREFWGRRYNYFVHKLLKDSVFEPIYRTLSVSSTVAALATFL
ncbi:unnamed protein product [Rotaria socialis]|uniref:Wax synthase domain-containing protein n=1 Tax=Rotaria socialis TaxID=392032 RepID=A0A820VJ66_9BILA|nr:unnamed protein product [Rotaria socialis]CAF3448434.1 unnamed protein product [Rotaria socialis]CAF4502497.1 unnamed protein product [Rotaria socialis]CAF4504783.1 unnamed protein product [Rotaria socialis]CAF4610903.1 unnamed protein product [Rotaria socialis]